MTRYIDPKDITTKDPAPALAALGWVLSAPKSNRWSCPGQPDICAFMGRGGDWMITGYGKPGNLLTFVRTLKPGLSFPEALIRANELLLSVNDDNKLANFVTASIPSTSHASSSKNPTAAAATRAAASGSSPTIERLTADEIRQKYTASAEVWRPGHALPLAFLDAGISHISAKFDEAFAVSGEGSARIPEIGLSDNGQPALVGYETRRANGRIYKLKGGHVGISITCGLDASTSIIVTDSLADAMAHDLVRPEDPLRGYIAVSPGAEDVAARLIRGMISAGSMVGDVIISTTNASSGMLAAHKFMSRLDRIEGLELRYEPPAGGMRTHVDALRAVMRSNGTKSVRIREAIERRIAADAGRHPGEYRPEVAYAAE